MYYWYHILPIYNKIFRFICRILIIFGNISALHTAPWWIYDSLLNRVKQCDTWKNVQLTTSTKFLKIWPRFEYNHRVFELFHLLTMVLSGNWQQQLYLKKIKLVCSINYLNYFYYFDSNYFYIITKLIKSNKLI